jgi:hypothetical protein
MPDKRIIAIQKAVEAAKKAQEAAKKTALEIQKEKEGSTEAGK